MTSWPPLWLYGPVSPKPVPDAQISFGLIALSAS